MASKYEPSVLEFDGLKRLMGGLMSVASPLSTADFNRKREADAVFYFQQAVEAKRVKAYRRLSRDLPMAHEMGVTFTQTDDFTSALMVHSAYEAATAARRAEGKPVW